MSKKSNKVATVKVLTTQEIQANVLATFAYHCGEIMREEHLNGFGLCVPNTEINVFVTMKITQRAAESGWETGWDQVEVNGVVVGNRCAARNEYARLCAPVIAAAFAL